MVSLVDGSNDTGGTALPNSFGCRQRNTPHSSALLAPTIYIRRRTELRASPARCKRRDV